MALPKGDTRSHDYRCGATGIFGWYFEDGVVIGRIFFLDVVGPQDRPWMWASGHNGEIRRAAHGYEPACEAAMAAFAKQLA